jgi:hypothetical protein
LSGGISSKEEEKKEKIVDKCVYSEIEEQEENKEELDINDI